MRTHDEEGVDGSPSPSPLKRALRDPVAYFVGLAVLLFAVAEAAERLRAEVIEIDPLEVEARVQQL